MVGKATMLDLMPGRWIDGGSDSALADACLLAMSMLRLQEHSSWMGEGRDAMSGQQYTGGDTEKLWGRNRNHTSFP